EGPEDQLVGREVGSGFDGGKLGRLQELDGPGDGLVDALLVDGGVILGPAAARKAEKQGAPDHPRSHVQIITPDPERGRDNSLFHQGYLSSAARRSLANRSTPQEATRACSAFTLSSSPWRCASS